MSKPFIKHPVVYGHPQDPSFETSCPNHAKAYEKVYPIKPWLRDRLHHSGRFTDDVRLEGQLRRDIDLLVEYETGRLTQEPQDFFGMDEPEIARKPASARPGIGRPEVVHKAGLVIAGDVQAK